MTKLKNVNEFKITKIMTEEEDGERLKDLLDIFSKEDYKDLIDILKRDQDRHHQEQLKLLNIDNVSNCCNDTEKRLAYNKGFKDGKCNKDFNQDSCC
jgi:hypothetical protein